MVGRMVCNGKILGLVGFLTSTGIENSAETGRWSENLLSLRKYESCSIPFPYHRILSHLPPDSQQCSRYLYNLQCKDDVYS